MLSRTFKGVRNIRTDRSDGKSHSVAVIANKQAKNFCRLAEYTAALDQREILYQLFESEPDAIAATIAQCVERYSQLLIGGGDGTIRSAAQLCANTSVQLGVLPLGTLNHLAQELGLPIHPEELAKAMQHQQTITIDVCDVNGYKFLNNSSIGFYPRFTKHRDEYKKWMTKWLSYLPGLWKTFKQQQHFLLSLKSQVLKGDVTTEFFMVSNNLYSYRFPMQLQRDSFQDGVMGMYLYQYGSLRIIKIIDYYLRNKRQFIIKHTDHPIEVRIKNRKKVLISLDGEAMSVSLPLKYTIEPQALTFITQAQ